MIILFWQVLEANYYESTESQRFLLEAMQDETS